MDRRVYLAARVRPLTEREISQQGKSCVVIDPGSNCITIVNPENGDAKAYVLDHVYDSSNPPASLWTNTPEEEDTAEGIERESFASTPQGKVPQVTQSYIGNAVLFRDMGIPLLEGALDGYNSCLFVHGHAGSGRTHTMVGMETDPGLLPRIMEGLFQNDKVLGEEIAVHVSFYAIQNEQVRDMLQRDYLRTSGLKVMARRDGKGSVVEGLSAARLRSMSDCEDFLANVLSCMRLVMPMAHTVVTMELSSARMKPGSSSSRSGSGRGAAEELVPLSKIHLVELAGCGTTDVGIGFGKPKGEVADRSLLAWGSVMSALAEQQARGKAGAGSQAFIPFRGSVLTRILQDSMGDKSRTAVVTTLSPSHKSHKETLNTFRAVTRTKEVQRVSRKDDILNAYLGDNTFIPAAGGGWKWSYCVRGTAFEDSQE